MVAHLAEWDEPQTTPEPHIPTQVLAKLPVGWSFASGSVCVRWLRGLSKLRRLRMVLL